MSRHQLPEHIGRVRLSENEARLVVDLLRNYRAQVLEDRKQAIASGDSTSRFNRELHLARKVWQELDLLSEQKGWFINEPESWYQEGPDTEIPPGQEG